MLKITEITNSDPTPGAVLTLRFEERQKSRLATRLEDGMAVGLMLPRGSVLRHGDRLRAENGMVVEVHAAAETVSTAYSDNPVQLARASYHLGNRHVPLQVGTGWVRYAHDHVLDDMVIKLGLKVVTEQATFEPEAGAYHSGHHHHGHHD